MLFWRDTMRAGCATLLLRDTVCVMAPLCRYTMTSGAIVGLPSSSVVTSWISRNISCAGGALVAGGGFSSSSVVTSWKRYE